MSKPAHLKSAQHFTSSVHSGIQKDSFLLSKSRTPWKSYRLRVCPSLCLLINTNTRHRGSPDKRSKRSGPNIHIYPETPTKNLTQLAMHPFLRFARAHVMRCSPLKISQGEDTPHQVSTVAVRSTHVLVDIVGNCRLDFICLMKCMHTSLKAFLISPIYSGGS